MEGYKQHHQDDPELYSLDDLQLDTEAGPHQRFKTLGSGGFGSVYLARLPKRTDTRLTPSGLVTYDKEDLIFLHDMQYGGVVGWDAPVEVLDPAKNETKRYIQVAVKRLTQYSADHLGDLVNEALRLRNLWGSRNVVTVYGVIFLKELECPCIVMERVQGSNLNSFLQRSCKQDLSPERDLRWWKTKIEIFRELVLAVMLCHKQGIYHGDLKGENVLLDEFISPRLVDFGLSFIRRRDKSYYRTFAGSLFWVSPEIYDYSESSPSQELKENPFPSDVYSLGMILVEMFLDGSIPEFVENDFVWDKLLGGVPIPIEPLEDSEDWLKQVVERLADIAEGCCALREARVTLLQCLEEVEDLYAFVCETFCTAQRDAREYDFCTSQQYQEMVMRCKTRFPGVQHWVLMQPSKSMLVDGDGNCLIHYFCRLDFVDGVKHIIDRAAWNFQPSRDVVEMSYLSVVEGSISVLRFLGSQWGHILSQELDLVHEACNYDNADILRFLAFDMQMDFSTYYEQELLKPIHKLAKSGRNELIQVLLDAFAHSGRRWRRSDSQDYVNTTVGLGDRYRNDKTPLHYAVQEDQAHTVVFLLEKGGKLAHTNRGLAARACAHGSVQVVRKLTELGYSFDEDSFVDRHPLEYICDNQDEQLLELLKGRIKNLKHIDGWSNFNFPYPPLCSLCRSGNLGMAKTLILEMGANAKFVDREGNTLLHVVAQAKGSIEIAQLLINSGIDLHLENKFGQTALDIAMDNATVDLQSVLQHAGASTGQRAEQKGKEPDLTPNKWVQSPAAQVQDTCKTSHGLSDSLAQAVEEGDIIKVSQILSTRPLKTNCSTNDLLDLLKMCCSKGHLAILQLLHSQGADLYGARTPEDMRSPLHWAVQHRQVDIIRFLIDEGVAVNSQKHSSVSRLVKRNNTEALHHAADLPSEEIMEMLLKAGANANALDRQNYTAMDRAIGFKNKRMVDMLIEHGFDTSQRDKENRSYLRLLAETF